MTRYILRGSNLASKDGRQQLSGCQRFIRFLETEFMKVGFDVDMEDIAGSTLHAHTHTHTERERERERRPGKICSAGEHDL